MLLVHLIVIIFVIIAFCFIIQRFASLYVYRKLHNRGVDDQVANLISQEMSLLMAVFYGILILILVLIAAKTFSGGVII